MYIFICILTRKMFALHVFPLLLSKEIVVRRKENLVPSYFSTTYQFTSTVLLSFLIFPPSSVLGSQKQSLGSLRYFQPLECSHRNYLSLLVPKVLRFQTEAWEYKILGEKKYSKAFLTAISSLCDLGKNNFSIRSLTFLIY